MFYFKTFYLKYNLKHLNKLNILLFSDCVNDCNSLIIMFSDLFISRFLINFSMFL
ncbi:hypothetical protein CoNPh17_CDS0134 [Staphylococcus phage S-CoN_Ph17]|nr:hypothetical protein CoNPh17_CDS0134 [Staphylococcus phage S-CoN_Ph17]